MATLGELQRALARQTYPSSTSSAMAAPGERRPPDFEANDERGYAVDGSTLGTLLHPFRRCGLRCSMPAKAPNPGRRFLRGSRTAPGATGHSVCRGDAVRDFRRVGDPVFDRLLRGGGSGQPVDQAVALGRLAIFSEVSDLEWATPVLYLRSPDGRIFAPSAAPIVTPEERTAPVPDNTQKTPHTPKPSDTAPPDTTIALQATGSTATALAAATLMSIFLGAGMALWAVAHLTFNLVSLTTASALIRTWLRWHRSPRLYQRRRLRAHRQRIVPGRACRAVAGPRR